MKMNGCNEGMMKSAGTKGGTNKMMQGAYEKTAGMTMAGTKDAGKTHKGIAKTGSSGPRGTNPVR